MKIKLLLLNISFIVFVIGLLCTIGIGMQSGASVILIASFVILLVYAVQLINSTKQKNLLSFNNLLLTVAILVVAVIFIHSFSVSIAMPFLGNIPMFSIIYLVAGLLLILIFLISSIRLVNGTKHIKKTGPVVISIVLFSLVSTLGLLGMGGIVPISGWFLTYSILLLTLFYIIFSIRLLFSENKISRLEVLTTFVLSALILMFLVVRFFIPQLLPDGLTNSIITFGFIPAIVLPLSIAYNRKLLFFTVFVIYIFLIDIYFIHTNRNFSYLIKVGTGGCIGYNDATTYPINMDPEMPIEELLKNPTEAELETIEKEWKEKDFSPQKVHVEYLEVRANGDSLKVVSHIVNGQKHYGLIRIPKTVDLANAPILLGLMGGGTGIDVLKVDDLNRLASGSCRNILNNYISIMPSFRGNIVRGDNFCFRSEGYSGEVWLGAAEDAIAFLQVVKSMYKLDSTRTLAKGTSRGATVALIIGALTDKIDYVISTSTHTKFLDKHVLENELVGGSFSHAFYTPKANPDDIRKRIVASSPYYFLHNLPAFEIHQGTQDQKTTVWHVEVLKSNLEQIGRNDSISNIYIYDGKGHGYDDDATVCASLDKFLQN